MGRNGDSRSGSGSSGRGERQASEALERLGELFCPRPGGVEAQEGAPAGEHEAPGGMPGTVTKALGQAGGEVALEAQARAQAPRSWAISTTSSQAKLEAKLWPGKRSSPVALASFMWSSTWAWPRWRASR